MSTTTAHSASSRGSKDTQISKKGGYSTLNINFKAGRGGDTKGYGKSAHGMQSLGKVAATSRRMPNPASLPSLRSENSGNDPSVTLVPAGGGGWKNSKDSNENREENPSGSKSKGQKDVVKEKPKPSGPPVKGPPVSPGRIFKSEFPSLEEQEGLSKKEAEERHRGKKERGGSDGEKGGGRGQSGDAHGPENRPQGDKSWREYPPPMPGGPPHGLPHGHHPPPGHFLQGGPHFPQGRFAPFLPYPHNHGMAPYGVPPMMQGHSGRGRGNSVRYPPQPHPMPYRPQYPPHSGYGQNPFEMPDQLHHSDDGVARPPTVKRDELKQLDVNEEDEGGWAGHHEEVDYTKEVVFSDSSDEEMEPKEGGTDNERGKKGKEQPRGRSKGRQESSSTQDYPRVSENTRHLSSTSDPTQNQSDHKNDEPLPLHKDRSQDRGGPGPPRPNMPQYTAYPSYPPYPNYSGYQMYPPSHPYPMPPHGFTAPHTPPHQRYGHNQKRGQADRDDTNWRQDSENERPKDKRVAEDRAEERPRILTKQKQTHPLPEDSKPEQREKALPLQKTNRSFSSDAATNDPKHVSFEEGGERNKPNTLDDLSAQAPTRRTPQRRVMLRKLEVREGEIAGEKTDQQQTKTAAGKKQRSKDVINVRAEDKQGGDSDREATPEPDGKAKHVAWTTKQRVAIPSKTLYEPEGKKSEAKFLKYQAQATIRTGSRSSQGSTTPTTEIDVSADLQKVLEGNNLEIEKPSETSSHPSQSPDDSRQVPKVPTDRRKGQSEQTHSEFDKSSSSSVRKQHDGRRAFQDRTGPYREEQHSRHDPPRRGEKPRHDAQRHDRSGPARGRDFPKQDVSANERQKDHQQTDHVSKPARDSRIEDKHGGLRKEMPSRDQVDAAPSQRNEPEKKTDNLNDPNSQAKENPSISPKSETEVPSENVPSEVLQAVKETVQKAPLIDSQESAPFHQIPPSEQVTKDHGRYDSKRRDSSRPKHDPHPQRPHRYNERETHPQRSQGHHHNERHPPRTQQHNERESHGERYPTKEREDVKLSGPQGGRPSRAYRTKPQTKPEWSEADRHEEVTGKRFPSQESRKGPTKQAARDHDNRQPSHKKRSPMQSRTEDKVAVKTEQSLVEVTGYPALGYDEVIDINSDSDWEGAPLVEADPQLTVPQRAMEGQPLLPTPPIEARTYDSSHHHQEEDMYSTQNPQRVAANYNKRQFTSHSHEPCQDLREKIRGNTVGKGRGKHQELKRERKDHSDGLRGDGSKLSHRHQPPSTLAEEKYIGKKSEVTEKDKSAGKDIANSKQRLVQGPKDNQLDAIPPPDSPVVQPTSSKTEFDKYDLNSSKVSIIDDISITEEGRLSPTSQAEFVEVTSKKTQKEKQRKEKEEQRKQEEKRKEDEKRKRKMVSSKPAADKPPSDNKPFSARSVSGVNVKSTNDHMWGGANILSSALEAQFVIPAADNISPMLRTNAPPAGCIGDNRLPKPAVPYTAELTSPPLPLQDHDYSLFPNFTFPYPPPVSGMLDATIDSAVPVLSPPTVNEDISVLVYDKSPLEEVEQKVSKGKMTGEHKMNDSYRSAKNLPPRLKSQQSGTVPVGRGRGTKHTKDSGYGAERKEKRVAVGRQLQSEKGRRDSANKEHGQEIQSATSAKSSVPKSQPPTTTGSVHTSSAPTTDTTNKNRFYIHPQRRSDDQSQQSEDTKKLPDSTVPTEGTNQDNPQHQRLPSSKVVPFEDHTPDTPTNVSVTTGQQLQRAGSSTAMRPERECVGQEKVSEDGKEKCECDGRPLPSSSSSKEGIKTVSTVSSELTSRLSHPLSRSGPTNLQVRPVTTVAAAKAFSYAQVLKSTGRSSSATSSQYSSRSETPLLSSVYLTQTQEEKASKSVSSSRSDSPSVPIQQPIDGDVMVNVKTIVEDMRISPVSTSLAELYIDSSSDTESGENNRSERTSSNDEMIIDGNIVVGGFRLEDLSFKRGEITFPAIEKSNVIGDKTQHSVYTLVDVANTHVEVDSNSFPQVISSDGNTVGSKKLDQLTVDPDAPTGLPDSLEPSSTMMSAMCKTDVGTPLTAAQLAPIDTSEQTQSSKIADTPSGVDVAAITVTQPQDSSQAARPFEAHRQTKEHFPLGGSASIMQHVVQSHPTMKTPPIHIPSTHFTSRVPVQGVSHLPPRSLIRPSMTSAVPFQNQTPIPLQHGEFQRQQALMPTPSINTLPDQLFSSEGSTLSLYRALADLNLGLPTSMAPPARNVKSNEQLEAIAKVKEHMATTQMLEAQRKAKHSSQGDQSSQYCDPTRQQPGLPPHSNTRLNNAQHMAKAKPPVSRHQEMIPQHLVSQASLANQAAYYKQPPLLIQPPQTGRQGLIPGQPSPVHTPQQVPHVPQLSTQQYLLLKQLQIERVALFQYQQNLKRQQAIKMATQTESTAVSSHQPIDPSMVQYHAYPHQQMVNPLLHTSVQPQIKSAFSPYPKNSAELGGVPAQHIYSSHDQNYLLGLGQENRKEMKDMEKPSGLSVSAIPFVPCTTPGSTSGGLPAPTTGTNNFLLGEASTVDRPPLSQPILYHPTLQMRAPPKGSGYPFLNHSMPGGVSGPALRGQSVLPVQIPQSLLHLTQSQINSASAAAQQRKPQLATGVGGIVPRAYPQVTDGQQVTNPKILQQMVESQHAVMASIGRQYSGEGSSSSVVRNKDFHLSGSRKPGYSSGNVELYSKQNVTGGGNASQMSAGLVPEGPMTPGKQSNLRAPSPLTSLNTHRRTALLPTPVTSHNIPMLISEQSRIAQGVGQQWQTPQRHVVPLSLNQSSLASQDQLQQSLYNSMVSGSSGHHY